MSSGRLSPCIVSTPMRAAFTTVNLLGVCQAKKWFNNWKGSGTIGPRSIVQHMRWDVVRRGTTPPDLVISTNMISGIDISEFNTMIVNCMPRNIAEYIQASKSRVARDKAGLVITVHHPFRSRDLSHYERFIEFHEKMYSYVELISITPVYKKALNRYLLHIATIVRHQGGFYNRFDANSINEHEKERLVRQLMRILNEGGSSFRSMKDDDIEAIIKKLLTDENLAHIDALVNEALTAWLKE